ncbi:hypothetical protein NPIL_299991 [Nephila pilipes]|uniref:Uncharacterized protein n=1 Tax=Nephila pilipes TaxID=299642 RepID=A0A8X6NP71_NEPPI|nr:hypothetical protein NPIL_299991 [Nephila pilipes]
MLLKLSLPWALTQVRFGEKGLKFMSQTQRAASGSKNVSIPPTWGLLEALERERDAGMLSQVGRPLFGFLSKLADLVKSIREETPQICYSRRISTAARGVGRI